MPLKPALSCATGTYTLFDEKCSTFFFNKISLPERRNKRKSVLEITKMYYYYIIIIIIIIIIISVVRAFAHGAMGRRIDPSWSGPTELFLVPASSPRLA